LLLDLACDMLFDDKWYPWYVVDGKR